MGYLAFKPERVGLNLFIDSKATSLADVYLGLDNGYLQMTERSLEKMIYRIPHPCLFLLQTNVLDDLQLSTLNRPVGIQSEKKIIVNSPGVVVWAKRKESNLLVHDSAGSHIIDSKSDYEHGDILITMSEENANKW